MNKYPSNLRKRRRRKSRSGLAALEVVMTTAITMLILGFSAYWIIRLCRYLYSVIGEMVGSPLI